MRKLVLQIIGVVLFMLCSSLSFAAHEIKLFKVNSIVSSPAGSQQYVRFEVTVENIAYEKQVYVHLRRWDGLWIDFPLTYNRKAEANREVWSGTYVPPFATTFNVRFALKYVVAGQTYWDNNNGQDYTISRDSGTWLVGGVNVYNEFFSPTQIIGLTDTSYFGAVTLRNIAFAKQVRIHYSTDDWATVKTAPGIYSPDFWVSAYSNAANPNQYGFEDWRFQLHIGNANQVVYAIEYKVADQTYWDNNFGRDYRVSFTRQ